jgi:acetyl esterase/lipase
MLRLLLVLIALAYAQASLAAETLIQIDNPAQVNELPSKPADVRIPYGADPHQFADLRLPKSKKPYPVVIILHGGCWMSSVATSQNTAALADALRDLGVATYNVEYRGVDDEGGGWPGTFLDVAQATDKLRSIAKKYALDLNHVVIIGHSAGAQLGLWLAARHKLPANSELYSAKPLSINGVIAVGGIVDLEAYNAQQNNACGNDTIGHLLGNNPALLTPRYHIASPAALLPLGVPQILIYATQDAIIPANLNQDYQVLASKAGDNVTLVTVPDANHFEYVAPHSRTWDAVTQAVFSLLK